MRSTCAIPRILLALKKSMILKKDDNFQFKHKAQGVFFTSNFMISVPLLTSAKEWKSFLAIEIKENDKCLYSRD
jgi:hypothetical protein